MMENELTNRGLLRESSSNHSIYMPWQNWVVSLSYLDQSVQVEDIGVPSDRGSKGAQVRGTGATRSRHTGASAGVRWPTTPATITCHAGAKAPQPQAAPSVAREVFPRERRVLGLDKPPPFVSRPRSAGALWPPIPCHKPTRLGGPIEPGTHGRLSTRTSRAVARLEWPAAMARRARAHRAGSCANSPAGVPEVKARRRPHARHQAWRWPRVVPFLTNRRSPQRPPSHGQSGCGPSQVAQLRSASADRLSWVRPRIPASVRHDARHQGHRGTLPRFMMTRI